MSAARVPVAVLGATGVVGQQIVVLLERHPWLRVGELVGSPRSAGKTYGDAVDWLVSAPMPETVRSRPVVGPREKISSPVVLSALPGRFAVELEPRLASEGRIVCTNASAHRMRADVPLVIPDVNAAALDGLVAQPWHREGGALVANPNCVVTGLALALAPLHREWGLRSATVATLQALSGAGARGPAALRATGNVIPFIEGEEEKIPGELGKVLGSEAPVAVAASRVPVVDGHTAHVFLRLGTGPSLEEVAGRLEAVRPEGVVASLPSIPLRPVVVRREPDRPQPRLDAGAGGGMAVSVGRIRTAPPHDVAFALVVHNTVRGAAGACVTNAELCLRRGLLDGFAPPPSSLTPPQPSDLGLPPSSDLSPPPPGPACCGAAR